MIKRIWQPGKQLWDPDLQLCRIGGYNGTVPWFPAPHFVLHPPDERQFGVHVPVFCLSSAL